jgi:hypothetical protein
MENESGNSGSAKMKIGKGQNGLLNFLLSEWF